MTHARPMQIILAPQASLRMRVNPQLLGRDQWGGADVSTAKTRFNERCVPGFHPSVRPDRPTASEPC